jgi:cell wall assembly regulator SMI1
MPENRIANLWQRIEKWLAQHAPDRLKELNEGASDRSIATLEKTIGRKLPADYAASLRLHDGNAYLTTYQYLDSDSVAANWEAWVQLENDSRPIHDPSAGIIKPKWWHRGFVPFAEDSGGNFHCLDLDPGPKGTVGQVIIWEMTMGPAPSGQDSFTTWLTDYASGLANGRFQVDDNGFIFEA